MVNKEKIDEVFLTKLKEPYTVQLTYLCRFVFFCIKRVIILYISMYSDKKK